MPGLNLPNATEDVKRLNPGLFGPVDTAPRAEPQPAPQSAPARSPQVEAIYSTRVHLRVESRRCGRQCDPDNIVPKFHIDALRYASILRDDTNAEILLEVTETRVPTKKEEGCKITLTPL